MLKNEKRFVTGLDKQEHFKHSLRDVNEDVGASLSRCDESMPLAAAEGFHGSGYHWISHGTIRPVGIEETSISQKVIMGSVMSLQGRT